MANDSNIRSRYNRAADDAYYNGDTRKWNRMKDKFGDWLEEKHQRNPEEAEDWLDELENSHGFDNYLSEKEAEKLVDELKSESDNGVFMENPEKLFEVIQDMGEKVTMRPYFNKYALYLAINEIFAEQAETLFDKLGKNKEEIAKWLYKMAVHKLKNPMNDDYVGDMKARSYRGRRQTRRANGEFAGRNGSRNYSGDRRKDRDWE